MEANALMEAALQLKGTGRQVVSSSFGGKPPQMEITFITMWVCVVRPAGARCPGYDAVEKRWRHLNFFQYRCELVAKVPRVNCPKHGVRMSEVAWASGESGLTLFV
jgi:transposase